MCIASAYSMWFQKVGTQYQWWYGGMKVWDHLDCNACIYMRYALEYSGENLPTTISKIFSLTSENTRFCFEGN